MSKTEAQAGFLRATERMREMGVLNMIPVVGWLLAAAFCFFAAIPVSLLWNWLAPTYFYWLPKIYLDLPFWHVFGLLWLLSSLRQLFLPSVSATAKSKDD